jgi:AcrR family transcriptional regulator
MRKQSASPGGQSRSKHLVRPWQQRRSAATVQRITDATMRLLASTDFDSISVDDIIRLGKTSKGSFYFRFATKAHLLRYLAEETFTALSEESRSFFQSERNRRLSLAAFLDAFIEQVVTVYAARRNLLLAFLREARPGGDEVVVALVRTGSAESARVLATALLERRREMRHPNPEIAVPMAVMTLGVMLRHTILFAEQVSMFPGITRERFRSELTSMLWNYLNPPRPN